MNIVLKSITLENFKGAKEKTVNFKDDITNILGANGTGKTTIFDALTWLLFDKDSSYSNKFQIRPLDKEGNLIHHVEIRVQADFSIDGKTVSMEKIQKENWVKHRGNETATLEGNVNTYFIDGIGKSEKDFKAFVATLIDEDLFKILTNPLYFTSLNWKEQREAVMKLVVNFTDFDFAKSDMKYSALVPYFESITEPSTDDLRKTFATAINGFKKKQKEIPVRIDELSKQKVDLDFAELELAKKSIEDQIADLEEKSKVGAVDITNLIAKRYEISSSIDLLESSKKMELNKTRSELKQIADEVISKIKSSEKNIVKCNSDIENAKQALQRCEEDKKSINDRFVKNRDMIFSESEWVFDESTTVCSLCGQKLPEDKISSLRTEFESKKAKAKENFESLREQEKEKIKNDAEHLRKEISNFEEVISESEKRIKLEEDVIPALKDKSETVLNNLNNLPEQIDMSAYPEYLNLKEELVSINKQIEDAKNQSTDGLYDAEIFELKSQLDKINIDLSKSANNVQIDERIEELNKELRDVSQKIADQESLIYTLEEFIKDKMQRVSSDINSKFRMVQFKLFNVQINGGISETCECTYDGVPFNSLNSARKIQCGLDIINTLSDEYDKYPCIFIDNRESCTEIPNMKAQVINLYVAHKHKELTVME